MYNTSNYKLQLLSENDSQDFFAGTLSRTTTLSATQKYCKEIEEKISRKEYFPYLIIEIQTNKVIGLIDVKNINWDIPKGELGAFIDSDFEGRGLITALGADLIAQIVKEHKFKKLLCRAAEQNKRSIRLIERVGFTLEGTIRRDYKTTKGELVDLNYYGRLFD